jgi:hypothetical protein
LRGIDVVLDPQSTNSNINSVANAALGRLLTLTSSSEENEKMKKLLKECCSIAVQFRRSVIIERSRPGKDVFRMAKEKVNSEIEKEKR